MKIKAILIYVLLFIATKSSSFSQETNSIVIDSSTIIKKEFSGSIPEKYTNNDFNYHTSVVQSQNYIARAISWFFNKLEAIFGITVDPESTKIAETLIYIILIIIAVYIIVRLFADSTVTSFFNKKSKSLSPLNSKEEYIEQINLDKLINTALLQHDYRLAIRYMYLKVLKNLSVKNLIEWHFDKTNSDYQNELKQATLKNGFRKVSYLYDHIWYGEFSLNKTEYTSAKKEFDTLNNAILTNE